MLNIVKFHLEYKVTRTNIERNDFRYIYIYKYITCNFNNNNKFEGNKP